jgi:hypothetical protein
MQKSPTNEFAPLADALFSTFNMQVARRQDPRTGQVAACDDRTPPGCTGATRNREREEARPATRKCARVELARR